MKLFKLVYKIPIPIHRPLCMMFVLELSLDIISMIIYQNFIYTIADSSLWTISDSASDIKVTDIFLVNL
jgi:hypothetical protein